MHARFTPLSFPVRIRHGTQILFEIVLHTFLLRAVSI